MRNPLYESSDNASLVLLYPPGPDLGRRLRLGWGELFVGRGDLVLGRGHGCHIQIDDDRISDRHARMYRSGEEWHVDDLQSTHGSYVNEKPITTSVLRDGDFVRFGGTTFKFLIGAEVEARYQEEIYTLTVVDAGTGAHNKRYLLELLEREIARCARHRRPLSLVMFDIDHLEQINDRHGHVAGDQVLRELCRRLSRQAPREQLFARWSGEALAMVLPETDLPGARTSGEWVRRLVADRPFEYEGAELPVTVSVGVACVEGVDIEVMELIEMAGDNLGRAKREGRNRVVAGAG